jgi:hypothetical protein
MRLSPVAMRAMLERGWMIQITGSKFFAGPPFAGALILPAERVAAAQAAGALPEGLGLYAGRCEWPAALSACAARFPATRNLGILARWQAAIVEMRRFQSVPSCDARTMLAHFANSLTEAIRQRPELQLIEAPVLDRTAISDVSDWTAMPTILSFTLSTVRHGNALPLSIEELKRVHRWLLLDLSAALPVTPSERLQRAAAARCHLGQPVRVASAGSRAIGALRLCASARVVTEASFGPAPGATVPDRLEALIDNARLALDKACLIARHFDVLARSLAT